MNERILFDFHNSYISYFNGRKIHINIGFIAMDSYDRESERIKNKRTGD